MLTVKLAKVFIITWEFLASVVLVLVKFTKQLSLLSSPLFLSLSQKKSSPAGWSSSQLHNMAINTHTVISHSPHTGPYHLSYGVPYTRRPWDDKWRELSKYNQATLERSIKSPSTSSITKLKPISVYLLRENITNPQNRDIQTDRWETEVNEIWQITYGSGDYGSWCGYEIRTTYGPSIIPCTISLYQLETRHHTPHDNLWCCSLCEEVALITFFILMYTTRGNSMATVRL